MGIAFIENVPASGYFSIQEIINKYAVASEDPNPLHFDPEFAKKTPFKGTIAHGTMYLAYVSQMLMQWFPFKGRYWRKGKRSGKLCLRLSAKTKKGKKLSQGQRELYGNIFDI